MVYSMCVYVCGVVVGISNSMHSFSWIRNALIRLAVVNNHDDCHVKFENRSSNARVVRGQSEHSLSLQTNRGVYSSDPIAVLLKLK